MFKNLDNNTFKNREQGRTLGKEMKLFRKGNF